MIKNKRLIAMLCTLALMMLCVAPALGMPNTVKVEQANGQIIEYSINAAIANAKLLADMNAKLAAAFEAGKKIVGVTSDNKVVDVAAGLSAASYTTYENGVAAGTIAQGTNLVADKVAELVGGEVVYNDPPVTVAVTAISATAAKGVVEVTAAGTNAAALQAAITPASTVVLKTGDVYTVTIANAAYGTTYTLAFGTGFSLASGVSPAVSWTETVGATGNYTITTVTQFSSDFGVTVTNFADAQYFAVYKNGSIIGAVTAITGKVRSLPAMFSDAAALQVKFFSDAAGATQVGTATCANNVLTITLPAAPTGTYSVTTVTQFSSDFGVAVTNLDAATYFAVYKNGSIIGSVTAINGKVRSLPAMFSDASALTIKFFSDAAGTTLVDTATCAGGTLTF